jgi:hypothetical protein
MSPAKEARGGGLRHAVPCASLLIHTPESLGVPVLQGCILHLRCGHFELS